MGIYLYSIRARKVRAKINGEKHDVHTFEYLTKPFWNGWGGTPDRGTCLLQARCDRYWEDRGGTPRYVVMPSGPQNKNPSVRNGDTVLRWGNRNQAWAYDTPDFKPHGSLFGWVFKKGRDWVIKTEKFSFSSGHLENNCLYIKDSGSFPTREQANAWIWEQNELGRHVRGRHCWMEGHKTRWADQENHPPRHISPAGVDYERLSRLAQLGDRQAQAALNRMEFREV
jgi:hypothetical protein